METKKKFNKFNNLTIDLRNNKGGVILHRSKEKFKYKGTNMFLTEMKLNSSDQDAKRKFIISIRKDGVNNDYEMTQMSFTEDELSNLKNNIEELITYKNNKEYVPLSKTHFQDLIGKKYKVLYRPALRQVIDDSYFNLKNSEIKYIEGYVENFNPNFGGIFYDKEFGFNIIPFKSIIQMLEIK